MSTPVVPSEESDSSRTGEQDENSVLLALRLGWLTSEVLGLVRHDVFRLAKFKRSAQSITGRLSVSHGIPEKKLVRRFVFSFGLLCEIAQELGLYDAMDVDDPLTHLTVLIDEYLADARKVVEPTLGEVRALLEVWSLRAWSELSAGDGAAARAMTYGASIADTYWFMRDHESVGSPQSDEETWRKLLRHGRIYSEVRRIDSLEDELPANLAPVLKKCLAAWAIEPELRKKHNIAPVGEAVALDPQLEKQIYRKLRAQNRLWRTMILGERTPISYLTEKDYRKVRLQTVGASALLGLGIVFLLAAVVWIIIVISLGIVPELLGSFLDWARGADENPTMSIIELVVGNLAMLAALAGAFWMGGRWVFEKWLKMGEWLKRRFTQRKIVERTSVKWNGEGESG